MQLIYNPATKLISKEAQNSTWKNLALKLKH